MVRLVSLAVALACAASSLAAGSTHAARADAHKKMIKVRDHALPIPSSTDLPVAGPSPDPQVEKQIGDITDNKNATDLADWNVKRDSSYRFTFYEAGL